MDRYPLKRERLMKLPVTGALFLVVLAAIAGCATGASTPAKEQVSPAYFIKTNEPIAIMPFESESAISNLGGQVSDEVIVNLLENAPGLKLIPATVVRNYLMTANLGTNGIPDMHTMHSLQQGLKCRYLLTGNLYTSIGEVRYTTTYSNRIASGSATVRLVDCDSSTVVWAKHVQSTYTVGTNYYNGVQQQSAYLTDGQLLQGLIKNLGYDIAKNFYER